MLVLACLLMAAAAPAVSGEALTRPVAAFVLGTSTVITAAARREVRANVREIRLVAPLSADIKRERRPLRAEAAQGRAAPDQRYLYLVYAKFLC